MNKLRLGIVAVAMLVFSVLPAMAQSIGLKQATAVGPIFTIPDTSGYAAISLQFTSAGVAATTIAEVSEDGQAWVQVYGVQPNSTGGSGPITGISTAGVYWFPLISKQFRVRVSSIVSGTVSVLGTMRREPIPRQGVQAGITGTVDVNNKQVNGITMSAGNGTTDTGTQRVTVSSDSTALIQAGTAGSPGTQVMSVQGIAGGAGQGIISDYPVNAAGTGAVAVSASSGNVVAATATATLAGASGKTTYISGFSIVGAGATAASVVSCTVTGLIGGTQTYPLAVPAGATVGLNLTRNFAKPVPASGTNTAIVVSCPSLGSGNTNVAVNAEGYQF